MAGMEYFNGEPHHLNDNLSRRWGVEIVLGLPARQRLAPAEN
jgi:hypothetical protein